MAINLTGNQSNEEKSERKAKRKLKTLRQSVKKANFNALPDAAWKEALREVAETLLLAQKDEG